ncbi:hypothetical protein B7463_g8877, partial [Scytalidium lignicola]
MAEIPKEATFQSNVLAVKDVKFEHYRRENTLGIQEARPCISWKFAGAASGFQQDGYEIQLYEINLVSSSERLLSTVRAQSSRSTFVPWPFEDPLKSRQRVLVKVKVWRRNMQSSSWSEGAYAETGLLAREDWKCQRLAAPWIRDHNSPQPEELYRKEFHTSGPVSFARLYITAQGLYEAEINGCRVGDYFLAPGWTNYARRLQYQTYDVTDLLSKESNANCIGVRIAEGWFCGVLGFAGGRRNIWGSKTALMAQLEIHYADGRTEVICTDDTWTVSSGPIRLAELYNGEKYDSNFEIPNWSLVFGWSLAADSPWRKAAVLPPLLDSVKLVAGSGEPVRRISTIYPTAQITTPSGKIVIDFGQNLVGYTRIKRVRGTKGDKISLFHAEVLEYGELGRRPLLSAEALDEYTIRGEGVETWEPRFTFHGFRYVQVDGWPFSGHDLLESLEAVVCHTDMEASGQFSCSDELINKLHNNVLWSMRGNFLSIPTDCPQRSERLGWLGDLALFAPAASMLYNCFGMLKNWLADVELDQEANGGIPTLTTPHVLFYHPIWGKRFPCAIWHDVVVLAPWALYEATGDMTILKNHYTSMTTWLDKIPRNTKKMSCLWDPNCFQFGDWLDPYAPPQEPQQGRTDAVLVANAFLIHSLDLVACVARILQKHTDSNKYEQEARVAKEEFSNEYISPNGRIVSDSQTAYALAICFDLLDSTRKMRAGERLAEIVLRNGFKIGTGFAGTPYICEALALTNQTQVAYAMLLSQECPSWLYPVTMGATTMWERWDSMLPDGKINPGRMVSFNHYSFGAVAAFLYRRLAGLQCLEPGWKRSRAAPLIGADFTSAHAEHTTPFGKVSCSWKIEASPLDEEGKMLNLRVHVPPTTVMEVVLPVDGIVTTKIVHSGEWLFSVPYKRMYEWPLDAIPMLP